MISFSTITKEKKIFHERFLYFFFLQNINSFSFLEKSNTWKRNQKLKRHRKSLSELFFLTFICDLTIADLEYLFYCFYPVHINIYTQEMFDSDETNTHGYINEAHTILFNIQKLITDLTNNLLLIAKTRKKKMFVFFFTFFLF